LIIKKSGEIGLNETLATIRQLAKTVPIPGRKRNYNLNKTNEATFNITLPEFHVLLEYVHALIALFKIQEFSREHRRMFSPIIINHS
jgi:hypothetical protein